MQRLIEYEKENAIQLEDNNVLDSMVDFSSSTRLVSTISVVKADLDFSFTAELRCVLKISLVLSVICFFLKV